MNYGELRRSLEGHADDEPCAFALWTGEDVRQRALETGEGEVSERRVRAVLEGMYRRHDCEVGLSWVVMDYWLDETKSKAPEGAMDVEGEA